MQTLSFNLKMPVVEREAVIKAASEVLRRGGLVIFPTETTYGAGVDATHQAAVDKLLSYKARREGKPLSIAVTDLAMAEQYVEVNDQAQQLYSRFLPGPVTVVSRSLGQVAEGVASEFGTLGVRMPDYPLFPGLVAALGHPITATSANASGEKRPYTIADIFANISDRQKNLIDLVIDAGTLPPNSPSTVIDTTLSTPVTLRQGEAQLTAATPTLELISGSETETKQIAGRLLLKHWDEIKDRGLIIGLDGPLGAGKTIFAKGAAEFLQITETITSPTYSYLEEYPYTRHGQSGTFFHLDVWKVDSDELWQRLTLPQLWQPGTVAVIEWWSQVADLPSTKSWLATPGAPVVLTAELHEHPEGRRVLLHDKV